MPIEQDAASITQREPVQRELRGAEQTGEAEPPAGAARAGEAEPPAGAARAGEAELPDAAE